MLIYGFWNVVLMIKYLHLAVLLIVKGNQADEPSKSFIQIIHYKLAVN